MSMLATDTRPDCVTNLLSPYLLTTDKCLTFFYRLHGEGWEYIQVISVAESLETTRLTRVEGKDTFLALLDYVSRAHEIKIRPASVVRPSVASIISEVIAWISFKF